MATRRLLFATFLAGIARPTAAQTPPATPLPREGRLHADMEPSLIVLNARAARLEGETLTLDGASPDTIVFADRPVRAAGHLLLRHLLEEWDDGADSFGRDPPNATVSVLGADGGSVRDAVVVLKAPRLEGETLRFTVQVLEGSLAGATGPASVFIDMFGMRWGFRPFGWAARRAARRAFWYSTRPAWRRPYDGPPPGAYPPY